MDALDGDSALGALDGMGVLLQQLRLVSLHRTAVVYGRWALQFAPSILAILAAIPMYLSQRLRGLAPFLLFFGGQSFMNLYIKAVLSSCSVDASSGLRGIPAPFAITAVQQLVGFLSTSAAVCVLQLTPWPYWPKALRSRRDCLGVAALSLAYCLNIGLNNLSLSMLDMSLSIVLRSLTPMMVAVVSLCVAVWSRDVLPQISGRELAAYVATSVFAACAMAAKAMDGDDSAGSAHVGLGSFICCTATLASAAELVLVSALGLHTGLNPVDVLFYTALPSTLMLAVPAALLPHPTWEGHGAMTDLQVVARVLRIDPSAAGLVLLSGPMTLLYNMLLYNIVQAFSAPHAAMAATANKAATILISVLTGLEVLPRSHALAALLVVGIAGTLATSLDLGLLRAATKSEQTSKG